MRQYLWNCGPYILQNLHAFERALDRDRQAKSGRKREETQYDLYRAASDVTYAVDAMKRRIEEELRDRELFTIDDLIWSPLRLSQTLSVRVSYSWRSTIDDQWKHGSITFTHEVDLRPGYSSPAPKRKPTKAQQDRELQTHLRHTWEHLKSGALYAVREFFKDGRSGADIPKTFTARTDTYSRGLNNHSTKFW
ncbi:hypothetical protein V7S57_12225 [Caulobacter sp. CCNWLY153]|uniref:hypothetical protein n=1 Tax=Caulobacter TaxID=75 RepID=UPI001A9C735C|nr:hypothetical protein [Caulobacter radicis]